MLPLHCTLPLLPLGFLQVPKRARNHVLTTSRLVGAWAFSRRRFLRVLTARGDQRSSTGQQGLWIRDHYGRCARESGYAAIKKCPTVATCNTVGEEYRENIIFQTFMEVMVEMVAECTCVGYNSENFSSRSSGQWRRLVGAFTRVKSINVRTVIQGTTHSHNPNFRRLGEIDVEVLRECHIPGGQNLRSRKSGRDEAAQCLKVKLHPTTVGRRSRFLITTVLKRRLLLGFIDQRAVSQRLLILFVTGCQITENTLNRFLRKAHPEGWWRFGSTESVGGPIKVNKRKYIDHTADGAEMFAQSRNEHKSSKLYQCSKITVNFPWSF